MRVSDTPASAGYTDGGVLNTPMRMLNRPVSAGYTDESVLDTPTGVPDTLTIVKIVCGPDGIRISRPASTLSGGLGFRKPPPRRTLQ